MASPPKKGNRRCNFSVPLNIDMALAYAAVEGRTERSILVTEALKAYLPTVTSNPLVLENLEAVVASPK